MRLAFPLFCLALSPFFVPPVAHAADIPCGAVEKDVITPDGLLEDWSEVTGLDVHDRDGDFSMTVKCNYDADTLYLAVDVRDDHLVRTRAAGLGEDHVEIAFADGDRLEKLVIHPGDSQSRIARKVAWIPRRESKSQSKTLEIADALQPRGWATELRIALASVPGWSPGIPAIRLAVAAFDADSKSRPAIDQSISTAPIDAAAHLGRIEFAEARVSLDAFLKDRKLQPRDITFDRVARVLPNGRGRVVVAGKTLAIIGEEYNYIELPVGAPNDIREVRTADLAGDGHDAVLVRYRERTATGTRDVLSAYRMSGEGLHRAFAVEVARAEGDRRLESRISYVKRKGATDIVVEPLPAVGWTEMNYRQPPADDVAPIVLPWSQQKRARFQFQGDQYTRAE